MNAALDTYGRLLAGDRSRWLASIPGFRQRLRERGAVYGERDLVKVLRPKFLTAGEVAELEYVSGVVLRAARRVALQAVTDLKLQEFLGVTPDERALLAPEPLCPDPCAFARLDMFMTADGPRCLELNAEAPAGAGYGDVIMDEFLAHPLTALFRDETDAFPMPTRAAVLHHLLVAWRAAGRTGRPRILITDFLDVPTAGEFHLLADFFRTAGFDTVVEDPRELTFKNGLLIAGGAPCGLVYRRVLVNDILARPADCTALVQAVAARAVVMVNPFRCKYAHKKTIFAVLTGDHGDAPFDELFDAEECAVTARYIPWTRRVRATRTTWQGRTVDLLEHVAADRQRFVLKPADDFGGRGVVCGWLVDAPTFARALDEATRSPWVVQERLEPLIEEFPMLDQDLAPAAMTVDLDPFLYFGRMHGVLARLAAGAISNVTSGGGQVPVLVVPEW